MKSESGDDDDDDDNVDTVLLTVMRNYMGL
jgi:hypothetical protein